MKIPAHRAASYDEAVRTLKAISQEQLNPDFPEIENRTFNIQSSGQRSSGIEYLWQFRRFGCQCESTVTLSFRFSKVSSVLAIAVLSR